MRSGRALRRRALESAPATRAWPCVGSGAREAAALPRAALDCAARIRSGRARRNAPALKRTGASRETVRRGARSDAGRRLAAPTERPPPNPARFVNCR
ncbi:hypothetical protein AQ876_23920 [Burkholderia pseudomallei]|nr:hypothetical protein AQ876_23920 [Burkholderia pseudomallei]